MCMSQKRYHHFLVLVQLICISLLLATGPLLSQKLVSIFIELLGFFLAFWALWAMQLDNLNASPGLKQDARMVRRGPYRLVRHPMYLSLLLVFVPHVIEKPTLLRILILVLLSTVLLIKIYIEEKLLVQHFPNYAIYRKKTWRLLPFIF
jgi:protein-S-isoprenylcysteine O-methyltransferase Ste14